MDDKKFCACWTDELLKALERGEPAESLFVGCAAFHYRENHMDEVIAPYIGDLPGFLEFLRQNLGWTVTVSDDGRTITANEGKPECVCPVAKCAGGKVSGALCNCSQQYAKKMFSAVCRREVQAKVKRSVLRDGKPCIYEIKISEGNL